MANVSTLLLVDDDDATRASMKMMLAKGGFRVIQTGDGATALDIFSSGTEQVDLLITDIDRPGMDGVALIHAVREIDPDIKVIVVSGCSEQTVRSCLHSHGNIHYLAKPIDRHVLVAMVNSVLAG